MKTVLQSVSKNVVVVFIAAIVMGITTTGILFLIDENSLLYYGDAVSHLQGARRFVDSNDPGIIQMGTVWLPLPHIIMMPFSNVDSLFSSGLAGLVNLPLHALTSVLIYKIILTQTRLPWIGMMGGLLYASNPNLIYLSITAMTEAPFLLFFTAAVYFLQKWALQIKVKQNFTFIFLSSIMITLATLCKYEAWILAPGLIVITIFFGAKTFKEKKILINTTLISFISFSGIVFWVGWNQIIFGNPLEFANTEFYAAASQAVERPYRDFLYLQPHNVAYVYGAAAFMISGPILLSFALSGFISQLRNKIKTDSNIIFLFMILPVIFTLFTMFIGIGEMNQWWFNARFATFLSPLIIILACIALLRFEKNKRKKILVTIIVSLFIFQVSSPAFGVVTYMDAHSGWIYKQAPYAKQTSNYIQYNYDSGKILIMTGSSQAYRIMISSGVDLKDYNEGIESFLDNSFFIEPWKYNNWLIIGLEPDSDSHNAVKFWSDNISKLENHYNKVYENEYYRVFKLK